ncbi:MAG: thiamine phosphate synthase [Gemmataceae bacterium]|nr:thiamine phosphate synthase [Gemmataceae bacterium]
MKLEFTPALSIALRRGLLVAEAEGLTALEPVHLLRGLLAEDEGYCVAELRKAGFDLDQWRQRVGPAPDSAAVHELADAELRVSASVRHILNLARDHVSAIAEEGSLASDQVLAALLAEVEELRRRLEDCGLDYPAFQLHTVDETPALVLDTPLLFDDPRDPIDAARIVDACANRAREALRVLEDHVRFVMNDAFFTEQLKELRHGLTAALADLPVKLLAAARDTEQDVGTRLTTAQETERDSLADVVRANAKRLQEALRSLEEYGKVLSPALGQAAKRLRYQAYTLEKALVLGTDARQRLADARLYVLVTESSCRASLVGTIREAVEGGADVIQLREKTLDDRTLLSRAREVRTLTRRLGALFIVNDRPDMALLAEADGVHLGQQDIPLQEVRRLLGPDALVGVSTHDMSQLRRALLEGASYVGVGPTFPSGTKTFAALAGLDYVREATAATSLPAFALGGIAVDNVGEVVAAGARRVAVSQAVCAAEDPRGAARALKRALA